MRKMVENKSDENIIRVVSFIMWVHSQPGFLSDGFNLFVREHHGRTRRGFRGAVARVPRLHPGLEVLPHLLMRQGKSGVDVADFGGIALRGALLPADLVEINRRTLELIRDEQQ